MSAQSKFSPNSAPGKRQLSSEARRQSILEAALDVFITEGFAAARLDDIVKRAGVAKGTIYLFFKDKDDLFEQVVVHAIEPVLASVLEVGELVDAPLEALLSRLFEVFERDVLHTKRREIVRLIIAEGSRFPKIAEIYHREMVSKGMSLMRAVARRAFERGETPTDVLARFPHLIFAPLLLSMMWEGLFAPFEPLDVRGLLAAHRDLLLASGRKEGRSP